MLGENIRDLRIRRNETQKYLAEIIGVTNQTIAYYENNKREPSLETLMKLAKHFGVTLDELVGPSDLQIEFEEFRDHISKQKEDDLNAWTWLIPNKEKKKLPGFRNDSISNIHKTLSSIDKDFETREIFISIAEEIFKLEIELSNFLIVSNKTQTDALPLFKQIMDIKKLYSYGTNSGHIIQKLFYNGRAEEDIIVISRQLKQVKLIINELYKTNEEVNP